MDEILGALFAVVVGMIYLPQVTNAISASRHAMTDVTTAQEQQQWASAVSNYVSQNMTTLESSATSSTPVTLSVATVQAANVGLPTNFSGTNPFNQTWTAQVLQPASGTLQVLAFGKGGNIIKDQELGMIARAAAGSGGLIPTNNSGAYSGATANAYGTYGAWKISTTGYSLGTGGAPATLLMFTNGALSSNYLYRNAIPGQPQLNEMNTALGMNGNNITDAGQVSANTVVTPAGNGVQVGSTFFYGDTANSAIRQSGGLYIQNQAGTAAAPIASVGNINSVGTVTADGAQINGTANLAGAVNISGTTTMANGEEIYNPGTQYIETGGGNLYLKPWNGSGQTIVGGGGGSGQLVTTGRIYPGEFLQMNALASPGAGCSPNGLQGADSTGAMNSCVNGAWVADGAVPQGTLCGSVSAIVNGGALGVPEPDGATTENTCQGLAFWNNGVCPTGYVYTTVFAADAVWFFSCVKT